MWALSDIEVHPLFLSLSTLIVNSPANCLITGGAGFIGSHLTEKLLNQGHRVIVVDDLSTGQASNLSAVMGHERLEYIQGTVEDEALVSDVVDRADRVYHLRGRHARLTHGAADDARAQAGQQNRA